MLQCPHILRTPVKQTWRSLARLIGNLVRIRESDTQIWARCGALMHVPSMELEWAGNLMGMRGRKMLSRWGCVVAICAVAICLGLAPPAEAAGHSGLIHRASCSVVRFYVAKFSASAAEMWARSHGATEAEIEAARRCLNNVPAQASQSARWTAQ